MRLLLVEDDDHVAALSAVLARHGFDVTRARSGGEALKAFIPQGASFGLVLLDLDLPNQDGFDLGYKIRKRTSTPMIMIAARSDVRFRIHGRNLGADDFMAKPCDTGELLARIQAVIRRAAHQNPVNNGANELRLGQVRIELPTRQVSVDGLVVRLTHKEFDLLALLARRPGVVVHRETIMSEVWGDADLEGTGRTLWVHVASLRAKLRIPTLIETVRGVGYRAVAPAE
ncbi:response regulator transcription factor [Streptomyces sp. NPDC059835]|uniref:response regulator transcription factor n=1 Tax=Streptomyces sp. NPDC059835 TaxID=3346967 RepID=UPI0036597A58